MVEPVFMKLGMYIMAPEPISAAYFINPWHQSVCLHVYAPIVTRQWLVKKKNYSGKEYTPNNRRIVGRVVFYAVGVVSRKIGDYFFAQFLV
jgi:hypothetical protein